ncbi:NAD(P)-dependent dehydrogenase (short-subunit alcohol dehydrogenase family) [Geomicrobium halophilum]|uniref:NAD(P)-dependent dehydrogenase (Short-subunit alcohol dehydrogenase family) n=1 Tax=Geomicrobium halophilum TaxID=549000 RepID=A0A841Q0W5_9BACL|nr:glucose 1-dehydrogenase [Geomicrobium halophilum]MBB6451392.1 NAD(P)-dependent dehydrogenase (short-subunit alcohol dehydrogenase family) [Geomicrobium halophilum]
MKIPEMFDLTGRTAVITGGSRGLGKSMATSLTEAGANVVIGDLDLKEAEKIASVLKGSARKVDVTDETSVYTFMKHVTEEHGGIDILVNNAGIVQKKSTVDMTLEEWQKTMDVNVNGVFLCSKYAAKQMINQNKGCIINIASMSSFIANTEPQSAYNASKGAVHTMTKCFALEWAEDNIRVNAIAPGYMKTQMTEPIFQPRGELAHVLDYVPMKRLGEAKELGGLVVFLASDASSFVTGSTYVIDGGYTIW